MRRFFPKLAENAFSKACTKSIYIFMSLSVRFIIAIMARKVSKAFPDGHMRITST